MKQKKKKIKIKKEEKFDSISCKKCEDEFGLNKEYIGVVTCPYCGEYVEG